MDFGKFFADRARRKPVKQVRLTDGAATYLEEAGGTHGQGKLVSNLVVEHMKRTALALERLGRNPSQKILLRVIEVLADDVKLVGPGVPTTYDRALTTVAKEFDIDWRVLEYGATPNEPPAAAAWRFCWDLAEAVAMGDRIVIQALVDMDTKAE